MASRSLLRAPSGSRTTHILGRRLPVFPPPGKESRTDARPPVPCAPRRIFWTWLGLTRYSPSDPSVRRGTLFPAFFVGFLFSPHLSLFVLVLSPHLLIRSAPEIRHWEGQTRDLTTASVQWSFLCFRTHHALPSPVQASILQTQASRKLRPKLGTVSSTPRR